MSYLVLARKYRPATFEQVIGQAHITQTLSGSLASGRLAHAFCFTGPRGVGKTSVARILAKALNCLHGPSPQPCGQCPACVEIDEGRAVDVQELDAASNRGVDDVRELREMIIHRPQAWRYRITILDEVHMLTREAFNALLKTLEEPPAHALFILATTDVHRLPLTILSRCQRYDFRRLSPDLLARHLEQVCAAEGFSLEPASLDLLAHEADGSTRDALSLLDQVMSYGDTQPSHQEVVQALGLVDRTLVKKCAQAILDNNAPTLLDIVDQVYQAGGEMQAFYGHLQEYFRNLAAALAAPPGQAFLGLTGQEMAQLKEQAAGSSPETLHEIFGHLAQGEEMFRRAQHPRLVMEMLLLKLTQIKPVISLDSIIAMLEQAPGALIQPSPELLKILKSSLNVATGPAPEPVPALAPAPTPEPSPTPAPPPATPPLATPPRLAPERQHPSNAEQGDPKQLIDKLANYANKHDMMLAHYLRRGQARWQDGVLLAELNISPDHVFNRSEEKQAVVNQLAREMWKGEPPPIKLVYSQNAAEQTKPGMLSLQAACQDPAVQAAIDILEAQPVEIKPLSAHPNRPIKTPELLPLPDEDEFNQEYYEDKNDDS
jgi:DNA polymerase-3 subunit gamma/tau